MNKEQLDRIEKNKQELIKRLKIIEKGLNTILPTPMKYRELLFDDLISYKEAAILLGISETTIQLWSKEEKIPFHYLNGKRQYSKAELMDWITHRPKSKS